MGNPTVFCLCNINIPYIVDSFFWHKIPSPVLSCFIYDFIPFAIILSEAYFIVSRRVLLLCSLMAYLGGNMWLAYSFWAFKWYYTINGNLIICLSPHLWGWKVYWALCYIAFWANFTRSHRIHFVNDCTKDNSVVKLLNLLKNILIASPKWSCWSIAGIED